MARAVAAPDKLRGTASAGQVAAAVGRAAGSVGWSCDEVPMADGGEGLLEAMGGARRRTLVHGPLGEPVEAEWRMLEDATAVVEMARASGLSVVGGPSRNDPVEASTAGTGELIEAAAAAGARRIVVGMGGSATTDGGWGAVSQLGAGARIHGVELVVACDVSTRFGEAAGVFGPQKGANRTEVRLLERRLRRLAQMYAERFGVEVSELPGAGAAGGLAGGLAALGATLVPGFELVAEHVGLQELIEGADLVVTGEGRLDQQSLEGKVVGGVIEEASRAGVGCLVVVGQRAGGLVLDPAVEVVSLAERHGLDRALADPLGLVEKELRAALSARTP